MTSLPFSAAPLLPEEIDRAYPLVQLLKPHIGYAQWRRFAQSSLDSPLRRGIMAVRDQRGAILGLASYHKEIALEVGPVLIAESFMVIDLLKPEDVAMVLIEALERQSDRMNCDGLRIYLAADRAMEWRNLPDRSSAEFFFVQAEMIGRHQETMTS